VTGGDKITRFFPILILPAVSRGSRPQQRTSIEDFREKVLRRIFGSKTAEPIGKLRKLQNKELHYLHSSANNTEINK
jgi:hypothetical protein